MSKSPVATSVGNSPVASVPFNIIKETEVSWDASASAAEKEVKSRLDLDHDQVYINLEGDLSKEDLTEKESVPFQEWGKEAYDNSAKSIAVSTDYPLESDSEMMTRLGTGNVEDKIQFPSQEEMAKNPHLKKIFDQFTSSEPVNYFKNTEYSSEVALKMPSYDAEFKVQWQHGFYPAKNDRTTYLIKAKEFATKVIDFFPADFTTSAYINRGRCELKLGAYEEALSDFSKPISRFKYAKDILKYAQGIPAYNYRGLAYLSLGKNEEALSDFSAAIEHQEEYNRVFPYARASSKFFRHNRGIVYTKMGLYEEALKDFSEEIDHNPNPESFRRRGFVYKLLGEEEKFKADFSQAENITLLEANPKQEARVRDMNISKSLLRVIAAIGGFLTLAGGALALESWRKEPRPNEAEAAEALMRGDAALRRARNFAEIAEEQDDSNGDFLTQNILDFNIKMSAEGLTKGNAERLNEDEKKTLLLIPTFEQALILFTELLRQKNAADLCSTLNDRLDEMFEEEDKETKDKIRLVINDELFLPDFCENKLIKKDDAGYINSYLYKKCLRKGIRHNTPDAEMLIYIIKKYEEDAISALVESNSIENPSFLKELYDENAKQNLKDAAKHDQGEEPTHQQTTSGAVSAVSASTRLDEIGVIIQPQGRGND